MNDDASLEKSSPAVTVRKGLLWVQRDKIFSRWKERYFVLTEDYLNCFKRTSDNARMSEMGEFLFKVSNHFVLFCPFCPMIDPFLPGQDARDRRLGAVGQARLPDNLHLIAQGREALSQEDGGDQRMVQKHKGEKKVKLYAGIGIPHILKFQECHRECLKRRRSSPSTSSSVATSEQFWSRKQVTDSSSIENWLQNRRNNNKKGGTTTTAFDSTPDINKASTNSSPNRITLDELSDLYKTAAAAEDDAAIPGLNVGREDKVPRPQQQQPQPQPVRMRIREGGGASRKPKIINRLSCEREIKSIFSASKLNCALIELQ